MPDGHYSTDGDPPRRRRRRLTPDEKMLRDRIAQQGPAGGDGGDDADRVDEETEHQAKPDFRDPSRRDRGKTNQRPVHSPHTDGRKPSRRPGEHPAPRSYLTRKGCFGFLRWTARLTVLAYLLGLAAVAYCLDHIGQANLTTAALMYLPPGIWLAPGFALLLPNLVLDWKTFPLLLGGLFLFTFIHLDFQWRADLPPGPPKPLETIRVLSWNRGQGKKASLSALKDELKLDFVLLQDAAGRGPGYQKDKKYLEFRQVASVSEFVLLSRWPILSAEPVLMKVTPPVGSPLAEAAATAENLNHAPRAARFVVLAGGQRVTLFGVHLPSPRDTLESYKRGAFLWGILGFPGSPWENKKMRYQAYWDAQMLLATGILDAVLAERGPVLVMGDFNSPATGPLYRMFSEHLQDAHQAVGSGYGFTFPGDTGNPLALFQPWLRLDYIYASPHWQVLRCTPQQVEAQHLPIFGEFKLAPAQP